MPNFFSKYLTNILFLLIPALFIAIWLFPSIGILLLIVSLGLGLFLNSLMIIRKNRETYLQGKIPRTIFIRNVCFEIMGTLFIMIVAGLIGSYLGKIATGQIYNDPRKFVAGILIGLLVGIAIGIFAQQAKKKLLWFFQKLHQ